MQNRTKLYQIVLQTKFVRTPNGMAFMALAKFFVGLPRPIFRVPFLFSVFRCRAPADK